MLVVHAQWSQSVRSDRLIWWAEDSTGRPVPPRRPGRAPRVRPHPFAATEEHLRRIGDGATALAKAGVTDLVLVLPSTTGPLPSPQVQLDALLPHESEGDPGVGRAEDDTPPTPARWRVPALQVEPDDALEVLAHLSGAADAAQLTLGAGTIHLVAVADLAADLVSRGRVLPSARWTADGAVACWLPVLTGADVARARSVALALPPAARAAEGDRRDAGTWTARALDALVDVVARSRLGRVRLHPAAAGTRAAVVTGWLRALSGRGRAFPATAEQFAALTRSLAAWQAEAVAGPIRGFFRLVEPAADGLLAGSEGAPEAPSLDAASDIWRIEFGLQASEQPSLVVDAPKIWRSRGRLTALGQQLDAPQETLLAQLARAHRLYPALESALRTARPAALELDLPGAHDFLTSAAPSLAAAGFGVLLPGWWTRPSSRFGVRLRSSTPSAPGAVQTASRFGLETMADFQWQLAIGDEPLSEAELAALSSATQPLVRLRGQWVSLDERKLAAGLSLLERGGEQRLSLGEVLHRLGSDDGGPGGLELLGVDADGWLGDLLSGAADQRMEPARPGEDFVGILRPYQERGLAWLTFLGRLGLGGVLADDMGLGKTVQLLALLTDDAPGSGPTLLVCPMSLVGNWQREAARFAPQLRVHVHHGAERARGAAFTAAVAESDLVVTTYALAARDAAALSRIGWHRVVVDEAQAIKNAATRAASAIRALPATQRIAVTGTPVENRLADLWSIMEFANPGLLGSATAFKQRFATPVEKYGDDSAALRLRRLTQPFVLRRMKTDTSIISDLPQKLEMEVVCNLTREQAGLYQAVVDDMMRRIEESEGIERRGLVLATMTKLKQVCNHPAHLLRDGSTFAPSRSGKLQRLEEILEEVLAAGEKALLFTQYAEFGGMLRAHLTTRFGQDVAFLHGGVSKAARDDMVARFQDGGPAAPPVFVLSLKAGGTGLTLTAANHVVHVDRWWNPAVEDQATDRAFRIGQRRAVQVRAFVCAGTVEERIAAMIKDKRGLAARIVGTGEQWLTELSTEQLRELIALESTAVVE